MRRTRPGSALGKALSPEPLALVSIELRPGIPNIASSGSPPARSRLQSVASMADKRRSVVFVSPEEQPAGTPPADGTAPRADVHLVLTRLTSFMKRKSLVRGKMSSINELAAAMDSLDQRILGSLEQLRQQNAAGLGHIIALHRTKSGKLAPNRNPSTKDTIPAYSPRGLLGAAVDNPTVLQRLKFHADEQQALHDGGVSSARGRLEDEQIAGTAGDGEADRHGGMPLEADGAPSGLLAAPGNKMNTSAVAGSSFGSPKWGATEGGRDNLGWVRSLVKFTEAQPFMDTAGKLDGVAALEAAGGEGASTGAGAAPKPGRREDVLLLQSWLQEMMAQTLAQVVIRSADPPDDASAASDAVSVVAEKAPSELADAALWMYGVAFEELQRQVATESKDRADLLSAMWEHCFNLVELRCSLTYEEVIAGIKQELQSARKHRQQLQAQVKALEGTVKDSLHYDRERYLEMEAENKRMARLLAASEEEAKEAEEEVVRLKKIVQVETNSRSFVEAELNAVHHQKDELAQQVAQLKDQDQQHGATIASHEADIEQLQSDLQQSRGQERLLSEQKTKLEVDIKRTQRDFQAAEILTMSLKEQLHARNTELAQLRSEQGDLQQRHASTEGELQEAKSAMHVLQREHELLQGTAADSQAELQRSIDKLEASLKDSHVQLAALQIEKQNGDNALKESTARENVFSSQLKQLTAAHEQQGSKLRQEAELRKNFEEELKALRAGLQVSQQKLEGMGLVFASYMMHHTAAEAWISTGPLSMGRQVVAVINQQLAELVSKQHTLQHDLAVAKEHWQIEEGVRVRVQEQLLDVKAQLSKVTRDKEAVDGVAARLEQQRNTLDSEVTQMRKMVADAEARSQAAHKKSLDAANETKRLLPLEGKVAKLEEQLHGSKADVDRLQQEVTLHQGTIRKLLDEKAAALEDLSRRTQALDAATAEIRQLNAAVRDREQLQASIKQLQSYLQQQLQWRSAQDSVLSGSMQQLAVAKQLLQEFSIGQESDRLKAAESEVRRLQQLVGAKSREVELLQQRLSSTEQQLRYTERQLGVAVQPRPAMPGSSLGVQEPQLGPVVEQLRKVLEVKEDRIRQLERVHSSAAASTSQLQALQADVHSRDTEIANLHKDLEAIRKKLQSVQEERMKVATKDLIALAADAHLPRELVKEMLHTYVHDHLRSEIIWTKAKLAVVSHLAKSMRAKLRAEQAARAQAEMESVCVEAFYLHQAIMDQRAAAVLFDSTFAQVQPSLAAAVQSVALMQQQLIAPGMADLDVASQQLQAVSAGLNHWLDKFQNRAEKGMQADGPDLEPWRQLVEELPESRPSAVPPQGAMPANSVPPQGGLLASMGPLQGGTAAHIVHVYAHRLERMLADGQSSAMPHETLFDAMLDYAVDRRGCSRAEASSSTGQVAALLAAARVHLHKPKQLLFGWLVGLAPSSLGRPLPEGAWGFLMQLLLCIARLHGASWQAFVKEWAEIEEGVGLPLQCVMDVLANTYNTDAPALLDCVRRSLVPLIRQGRRGASIDMDAFLLVMVNEFADGRCPVDPLAHPRRLTDGSLSNAQNYHANAPALPSLTTVSNIAAATGMVNPYAAATAGGGSATSPEGWRQKSPMRKRIVNLVANPESGSSSGGGSGGLSLSPMGAPPLEQAASRGASPGSPGSGKLVAGPRSPDIFRSMQALAQSCPGILMGMDSQLRRSAANNPPKS